ncbi:hypothetical protein [Thalassobacillus pellis]|uniref:hypothetical protein n=1 Tax=Thalassobacillus pellis TaxID=748008 RepID=UPI00195F3CD6|nr:hypothetical protein [Thalassobacillus pellis]MBM7551857.1 hypothetical protein [Thalassobacillus pellis]
MNGKQNRGNSWVALGTAGAIGAAAMYGISRMNRNGGLQQMAHNAQNSPAMKNLQQAVPGMEDNQESR